MEMMEAPPEREPGHQSKRRMKNKMDRRRGDQGGARVAVVRLLLLLLEMEAAVNAEDNGGRIGAARCGLAWKRGGGGCA
jgi:hypothetical protein